MSQIGLPSRPVTSRWKKMGSRATAAFDGVRWALGAAFLMDAFRDGWVLGVFLRWPGGAALPSWAGLAAGIALLVRRRWAAAVSMAAAFLALLNGAEFYALRSSGLPAAVVPFSLVTLLLFAGASIRAITDTRPAGWGWRAAGAAVAGPACLFLHLLAFGATDYARPAEAIVVFGARVYEDGSPSLALEDRVKHGIRLFRRGTAPVLVMSGSPEEVSVMRRLALEAGVPAGALELDGAGVNTWATLSNLRHRRVVAVSHYYHLARIKMAAGRMGLSCVTAPCRMTRRLVKEPWFLARECAALATYYFKG